jgi:glutathione-regulated potassium-efflux system ancillary protein KefG
MPNDPRVLILFAHPALQKSRANKRLANAVRDLPGVTFHDLYERYPDFFIDVPHEQGLLRSHDVIVFQHPFYWYNCPALLKEWLDLVLDYGFAYGPGGDALNGKKLLSVITTGGGEDAYQRSGRNHFTIRELLAPFEQTARLCGMIWLPPFVTHSALSSHAAPKVEENARDYARLVEALRDNRLDYAAIHDLPSLNCAPVISRRIQ